MLWDPPQVLRIFSQCKKGQNEIGSTWYLWEHPQCHLCIPHSSPIFAVDIVSSRTAELPCQKNIHKSPSCRMLWLLTCAQCSGFRVSLRTQFCIWNSWSVLECWGTLSLTWLETKYVLVVNLEETREVLQQITCAPSLYRYFVLHLQRHQAQRLEFAWAMRSSTLLLPHPLKEQDLRMYLRNQTAKRNT